MHIYLGLKCHSSSPELNPIGTYCLFVYGEGEISVEKNILTYLLFLQTIKSKERMKSFIVVSFATMMVAIVANIDICYYDGGDCCKYWHFLLWWQWLLQILTFATMMVVIVANNDICNYDGGYCC